MKGDAAFYLALGAVVLGMIWWSDRTEDRCIRGGGTPDQCAAKTNARMGCSTVKP